MAKMTFYPLGNADSILTEFADDRLMLIDYCHRKDPNDKKDKRADLSEELRAILAAKGRDDFDVVGFTHGDDDHVGACEDFFWFDHAPKYQGEGRPKMRTLWVPACLVLEPNLDPSARVVRQEARHRLKKNKDIRVFGNPGALDDWFRSEGIDPKSRTHLITHAGEFVPEFSRSNGQAEVFVHSPFSSRMEDKNGDRNNASLVLHVTFFEGESQWRVMLGGDAKHGPWTGIVCKTVQNNREDRLNWDVFKISHHCSYTALGPEKGTSKTEPVDAVKSLFERGGKNCLLISTSKVIPSIDTEQPPHKEAAAYYEDVAEEKGSRENFLVTMEEPTAGNPKPIVIEVTRFGLRYNKISGTPKGSAGLSVRESRRQG